MPATKNCAIVFLETLQLSCSFFVLYMDVCAAVLRPQNKNPVVKNTREELFLTFARRC